MVRPLPHLACFLLAALTAHVGLATAGPAQTGPRGSKREPATVTAMPQATLKLATATDEETELAEDPARWEQRIAARIAALGVEPEPTAAQPAASDEDLRRRLNALAARAGGRLGIHVHDLSADRPLYDRAGDARLNPASNHKLLTAIASAELLGADYSFETRVERDGDALYLVGEGDPSLQARDLYSLVTELLAQDDLGNVRRLVVDDNAFTGVQVGPGYRAEDEGASYQAPSGALSLAFNTVEVTVTPGPFGEAATVSVNPPSAAVAVVGRVHTGRGRPLRVTSERGPGGTTRIRVSGSLSAGHTPQTIRRRVGDPGLFTAGAFASILAERSGRAPLPIIRGRSPEGATVVATRRSQPLHTVLASALKYSNNFTTEQVLRTLGWRASATPGSWKNGAAAIRSLWTALGNAPEDLTFENGSGLSTSGRVTPRSLVRLLALTRRPGSSAAQLVPALASPGGEGTLRLRLTQAGDRVRAKTGTIGGVSALSGLITSEEGDRTLAFSILINGRQDLTESRRLQDRLVLTMVEHLEHVPEDSPGDRLPPRPSGSVPRL